MSVTTELKGYFNQLSDVEDDIKAIQQQIEELLDKQQQLQSKKRHLEREIIKIQKGGDSVKKKNFDRKDFPWSKKLEELRDSVFGMSEFRAHQLKTMNATLSGTDVILIMPTGGGKSLCFQLPALVSKGITLVVSPLVSLMEDQLMSLESFGIEGTLLNASSTKEHKNYVHSSMLATSSDLKLLYVTPEKIAKSKMFMSKLEKMYKAGRFARIVIDEVHCCSQWGHDFRPDYKVLGILKRQFPEVPLLGLTATATQQILDDVKNLLNVPYCTLLRSSYDRPNLFYQVRRKPRKHDTCLEEIASLLKGKFKGQSGIIYCFSRKETETISAHLRKLSIQALPYHADMVHKARSQVHRDWTQGRIQAVVATVAFGMGIDKPDVRFVIHHTMSKSIENYYQESGRAGRDGLPAYCILFYGFQDVFRQSTMVLTETQVAHENLYNMVRYCTAQDRCRRSLIASHFGETWDFSKCDGMCDNCRLKGNTDESKVCQMRDITSHCQTIYAILSKSANQDKKITANKLIDTWLTARSPAGQETTGQKIAPPSQEKCELIVAHLLLEGYLREDYHFTPFSTISYVIPGSRERLVTSMGKRVEMALKVRGQQEPELPQLVKKFQPPRQCSDGSGKEKVSNLDCDDVWKNSECIVISDEEEERTMTFVTSKSTVQEGCSGQRNNKVMENRTGKSTESNEVPSKHKKTRTGTETNDAKKLKISKKRKNIDNDSQRPASCTPGKTEKHKKLKTESTKSNSLTKQSPKLKILVDDNDSSDSDFETIHTVYTEQLEKIEKKDLSFEESVSNHPKMRKRKGVHTQRQKLKVVRSHKTSTPSKKTVNKEFNVHMKIANDTKEAINKSVDNSLRGTDDVDASNEDIRDLESTYIEQLQQLEDSTSP